MDVSFGSSVIRQASFDEPASYLEREESEMSSETNPQNEELGAMDGEEQEASSRPAGEAASVGLDTEAVKEEVIRSLHRVYDPEIPVNIYELGLIYSVEVAVDGVVTIEMTLTSPACPVAGSLPGEVEVMAGTVEGVTLVTVNLTWDPPWTPYKMSEAARLELNFW